MSDVAAIPKPSQGKSFNKGQFHGKQIFLVTSMTPNKMQDMDDMDDYTKFENLLCIAVEVKKSVENIKKYCHTCS